MYLQPPASNEQTCTSQLLTLPVKGHKAESLILFQTTPKGITKHKLAGKPQAKLLNVQTQLGGTT